MKTLLQLMSLASLGMAIDVRITTSGAADAGSAGTFTMLLFNEASEQVTFTGVSTPGVTETFTFAASFTEFSLTKMTLQPNGAVDNMQVANIEVSRDGVWVPCAPAGWTYPDYVVDGQPDRSCLIVPVPVEIRLTVADQVNAGSDGRFHFYLSYGTGWFESGEFDDDDGIGMESSVAHFTYTGVSVPADRIDYMLIRAAFWSSNDLVLDLVEMKNDIGVWESWMCVTDNYPVSLQGSGDAAVINEKRYERVGTPAPAPTPMPTTEAPPTFPPSLPSTEAPAPTPEPTPVPTLAPLTLLTMRVTTPDLMGASSVDTFELSFETNSGSSSTFITGFSSNSVSQHDFSVGFIADDVTKVTISVSGTVNDAVIISAVELYKNDRTWCLWYPYRAPYPVTISSDAMDEQSVEFFEEYTTAAPTPVPTPAPTPVPTPVPTPAPTHADYLGCYVDSLDDRVLALRRPDSASQTVANCQTDCFAQGHAYAGVEFGQECFCGSVIEGSLAPMDSECNTDCTGNTGGTADICGGVSRLSVWKTHADATSQPATMKPASPGKNYLGCYVDFAHDRALVKRVPDDAALTVASCVAACLGGGYPFAGMENAIECFCGGRIDAEEAHDSECSSPCGGAVDEACGGDLRLSVWKTADDATAEPLTPQPTPAPMTYPRTYVGCFQDDASRELPYFTRDEPTTMTIELCITECRAYGMQYAGLQHGDECFCGNTLDMGLKQADDTSCDMNCVGEAAEKCGGWFFASVYEVPGIVKPLVYKGCFVDDAAMRVLPDEQGSHDRLTIEMCVELCSGAGFAFAGLQFASQCFCGNTMPAGSPVSEHECAMACAGDTSQKCGGGSRNSVYATAAPANLEPVGCYADDTEARRLPYLADNNDAQMNVGYCIGVCASQGYTYAGLQFGQECYCGMDTPDPSHKRYETQCHKACSGDANQRCGGGGTNLIFETTRSQ